jgi:hypothetical protein
MNVFLLLLISLFIFVCGFFCIFFTSRCITYKERESTFKRFTELIIIYEDAKQKAFDYIIQQDIFAYHASGEKIGKNELPTLQKKFIKTTIDLCGPSVINDIKYIKGGVKSIVFELSTYFITRLNKEETAIFSNSEDVSDIRSKVKTIPSDNKYLEAMHNNLG